MRTRLPQPPTGRTAMTRRQLGMGVVAATVVSCTAPSDSNPAPNGSSSGAGSSPATPSPVPSSPVPSSAVPSSAASTNGPSSPAASSVGEDRAAVGTIIAAGLQAPWSITFAGQQALISERDSGRVVELLGTQKVRTVGTVSGVNGSGEGGLLGLAVRGTELYAYYTAGARNRVVRMPLQGSPGSYRLGAQTVVLDDIPAARNHNGGRIAFGPDGMLYIATGDALDRPAVPDLDTLNGKILRVTPTGAVPDDNPFPTSMVYSYGHRNVQGLAWSADGRLYATEFGEHALDELNLILPGKDYGWPAVEGRSGSGAPAPVVTFPTEQGSPSGLAIVRDTAYLACLAGERVKVVPLADPAATSDYAVERYGRIRDCVLAPNGEVWLLTNNTDGRGTPEGGDDRIIVIA